MPNFSFQNIGWILTISGWAVAGFFVFLGFFGGGSKARREEAEKLADGLIQRLNQTVDQQGKDIEMLKTQLIDHKSQIDHFKGRNAVLEELFKGRDPQMQAFLKDAPHLMEIAQSNNELANSTNKAVGSLADAVRELVERIDGGHLELHHA
ncbi:MAG: hypothetical protein KGI71_05900 [Patescibacteria group bacterium]|nr:hypothetical protein [Patescibacteria group bacterium]